MLSVSVREISILVVAVISTTAWCWNVRALRAQREKMETLRSERSYFEVLYRESEVVIKHEGFQALQDAEQGKVIVVKLEKITSERYPRNPRNNLAFPAAPYSGGKRW